MIARPTAPRSLSHVLGPRRIDNHVVRGKPNVGISEIVINPITVVVDVDLCELHAGKHYARGRLSQFPKALQRHGVLPAQMLVAGRQ